jgi:8-oxo-dGTP pyrophosphatase MutT (NUDIX family)
MPRQAHLRRLLEEFVPANASEERHRAQILQLIEQTEQPFSREQFVPGHVTASAFVTNPEKTDLLLILHSKLRRWLQPGGHVECEDTDVIASARREVLEEVGLKELELVPGVFDVDSSPTRAARAPALRRAIPVYDLLTRAQSWKRCAGSALGADLGADEPARRQ